MFSLRVSIWLVDSNYPWLNPKKVRSTARARASLSHFSTHDEPFLLNNKKRKRKNKLVVCLLLSTNLPAYEIKNK